MPEDERLTISVSKAAQMLGVSSHQVYDHLVNRADFPSFKVGERWLVSLDGLKEWVEKQSRGEVAST